MTKQTKIITYDLPLPIQKLYIKRLKHMIWRWEYSGICSHCPANRAFQTEVASIKKFKKYISFFCRPLCDFCSQNVGLTEKHCPCDTLKPKEALKRAKDFIRRFEHENPI